MNSFPNAQKGVRWIYKAGLLELTAALLIGLVMIFSIAETGFMAAAAGGCAAAAMILLLIGLILEISGLVIAAPEEKGYKTALWLTVGALFIGLFGTALCSFLKNGDAAERILSLIGQLLGIATAVFVIQTTAALLKQRSKVKLAKKGERASRVYVIAMLISAVLELIASLIRAAERSSAGLIILIIVLAVIYILASAFAFIRYLSFLGIARDELADE